MAKYDRLVNFEAVRTSIGDAQKDGNTLFKCTLCNVAFRDSLALVQHVSSDSHRSNAGKKEELPPTVESVRAFFQSRRDLADPPSEQT